MPTTEALRKSIGTAEDLESVVSTMKALAAVSIGQFEGVVEAAHEYNRTVEATLQVLLRNAPEGARTGPEYAGDALGAVIMGSDQGLCGQFNEGIVTHALAQIEGAEAPRRREILAVGARVAMGVEEAGYAIDDYLPVPSSAAAVAELVADIAAAIETWQSTRGIGRVYLYYNRRIATATHRPTVRRLLPVSETWLAELRGRQWPSKMLPDFSMHWDALLARVMRQHLLVALYDATANSALSEHASRLQSMQAAEQNIEERIGELTALYRQQRQTAITAELLDIVSGFEALVGDDTGATASSA